MMHETGEEKILRVARRKFLLGTEIIEGGRFHVKLTEAEAMEEIAAQVPELAAPVPEILDPTNDQLTEVLSRSPEDLAVLQLNNRTVEILEDEEQFTEFDGKILESFSTQLEAKDGSADEWEAC
jgi:hypothetical protein